MALRMNADAVSLVSSGRISEVHEPGMVIHCMVQECIAPDLAAVLGPAFGEVPGPGVRFALNPPVDAVSAAVGNAAELL